MEKHIKIQTARVLRSEDSLIMDIKNGFKIAEIDLAYKAAWETLENMPTEHSAIAKSLLSIGMGMVMRSIVEDIPEKKEGDENKGRD